MANTSTRPKFVAAPRRYKPSQKKIIEDTIRNLLSNRSNLITKFDAKKSVQSLYDVNSSTSKSETRNKTSIYSIIEKQTLFPQILVNSGGDNLEKCETS